MMQITITRQSSTMGGTPGKLTTDTGFSCDTLELCWKNNFNGVSCILPDTYNATLWDSPTLGHLVVRLEDKHGRQNCLLHNANFCGEASGDVTQVHGCTAVGNGYGQLKNSLGNMQMAILGSVAALSNLVEHIIGQVGQSGAFTVQYLWADGCAPSDMTDLNGAA